MSVELTIPNTDIIKSTSKPYTVYCISIRQPLRSYIIQKRFSDFVNLNDLVTAQAALPPPAELPPKTWLKNTISNPQLAEERRLRLEQYLYKINDAADARWRNTTAWKVFLNLPNSTNSRVAASGTAGRLTGLPITITDPSVWLDVHRDVRSVLREARQAFARREAATSAQAQHEASAEVKSALVKATAMILALEGGLKTMGGNDEQSNDVRKRHDTPPSRLGEGELRRRKDLLASIKKERESIEDSLSASVSRSHLESTDGTGPSPNDKTSLLNGPRNGNKSRRVLGAVKETDQTRQLDNEGVLQLQQQIYQNQEEGVSVLTKTVQNLKEMGVQINDELALQNEYLNSLDKDAGRLEDKVNIAKKRITKIK